MARHSAHGLAVLLTVMGAVGVAAGAPSPTSTGPSSSEAPYLVPAQPGVAITSILTVGDSVNDRPDGTPYRMVGIPDGLGAFKDGDGTFTVLMHHELREDAGAVRAHGARGAFVSRWTIEKETLRVRHGEDLIKRVALWSPSLSAYAPPAVGVVIGRLCSADLPAPTALFNPRSGSGYRGRLLLGGEETDAEGRAFAHALDGTSYQLPHLGRFRRENAVAHPRTGDATVVVGLDDSDGGQVYVYVGRKRTSGAPPDRAGLVAGTLYGVRVVGYPREPEQDGIPSGTRFELAPLPRAATQTGADLDADSTAAGVTQFQRPEDGAWDPRHPRDFYWVTTASYEGFSRLWRLRFDDPADPAGGGVIDMLLRGTEGQQSLDNMTVTDRGEVLLQEDPGPQPHLAKIWRYTVATGRLDQVARHDPKRFLPGAPAFLTEDEESSGIIPADDILGEGWFLLDVQAHTPYPGELVRGGQLLAMYVPPGGAR
jgi:hypothetical protein